VPGNFVYNPTNGSVLNTGTNLLSVQFTPSDTVDYTSASANASLVVSPAVLTVTASNASRPYGQTNPVFGGTITGLENQDNITAAFSCSAASNSVVGAYAIVPALVDPGDRETNYTVSLVNGTLTVAQGVPQVDWTNPVAMTYGVALSSNQLNATANVPGHFVYSPTNGAVPNAGTNLLSVQFAPNDTEDYTSASANVSLVVSPAVLTVTASNASRPYGQTNPVFGGTITGLQNDDNITATFSCNATSNSAVGAYAIVPALVDPGDRQTNYMVSLVNGTLSVFQAVPQLSWSNPASITYGAALSSNQLNATSPVPGSFVYSPTNGTVLNAGTNLLSLQYTPTDTEDYTIASANVTLVVLPAPLTVTASNASRAYGQTNPVFGGTIVGLENHDNITPAFSCSAASNSVVGGYTIVSALVDPGDRETNYTVSLVNGTLTVVHAVPQLSWTSPASITYGAALSSNQLNASASTPGSFVYSPSNGIVLDTGSNLLSVQFTPSDAVDYTNASASVSLVVFPAPLTVTASNASRIYGQTNPVFGGTIVGLQNQDNIAATFSCSATSNSAAGAYPIVPALVDPGDRETNYTVSLVNGTLTVFSPPVILSVQHAGGSFAFSWSSTTGQLYQIQTATNLAQPDWTNFSSAFTATNSTVTSPELIGTNAEQFYRVLLLP
jgi:hypothetical protein